ncbi:DUF6367 family protein [Paraburkholderia bannensis]|uniref:DUF6367 family protein n=1 Tax=Paraburkholderia bannensis TaxID=765414 RepID=UPI002AB621A2|nr:DUF6367 family protein [Paraburkholderia bannensis]
MRLFERIMQELRAQDDFEEIFVLAPEELLSANVLALEGRWEKSAISGWEFRLDYNQPTHPAKRHIHIRKVGTNGREASWNDNGTRHDKHNFDAKLAAKRHAQSIAREILGIPTNISLEDESLTGGIFGGDVRIVEDRRQAYIIF